MKETRYTLTVTFTEPLLGTVPKDPEVYKTFIESKKPDLEEDESATVEKAEERSWTGFHRDELGLFLYDYQVKGYLKEAAAMVKQPGRRASLRPTVERYVFVEPRRIYLGKTEPDGVLERPLRAMTMRGPRTALSRSDYVDAGTRITFQVVVLDDALPEEALRKLLDYGRYMGLGQWRSGSYGRFQYDLYETREL